MLTTKIWENLMILYFSHREAMTDAELFTLSSNDFGQNCQRAFQGFWNDREFSDVTLATDDGSQLSAHKIVLSSCSQFFRSLLSKNPHPHPLIFLMGVQVKELEGLLSYIYQGHCDLRQEDLDDFLKTGKDLLISGLTQDLENTKEYEHDKGKTDFEHRSIPVKTEVAALLPSQNTGEKNLPCDKCDYTTHFSHNLIKHFKAKHTNMKFYCKLCEYSSRWQQVLAQHVRNVHEGIKHDCDQCDFKATAAGTLKNHKDNVHKDIKYHCNECDFKTGQKAQIKGHKKRVHNGILHCCNLCGFKATNVKNLKIHNEGHHKDKTLLQSIDKILFNSKVIQNL